jgi:hypothetical protein
MVCANFTISMLTRHVFHPVLGWKTEFQHTPLPRQCIFQLMPD